MVQTLYQSPQVNAKIDASWVSGSRGKPNYFGNGNKTGTLNYTNRPPPQQPSLQPVLVLRGRKHTTSRVEFTCLNWQCLFLMTATQEGKTKRDTHPVHRNACAQIQSRQLTTIRTSVPVRMRADDTRARTLTTFLMELMVLVRRERTFSSSFR